MGNYYYNRNIHEVILNILYQLPDESLSDMIPSTKNEITVNDEAWCALFLIRGYPMTFRKIQDKLKRGAYESLTGFCSDVSDIVHHVGILYGSTFKFYFTFIYI